MSFTEFHQQDNGVLVGLSIYETDPDWELEPPSLQDGLIFPRIGTEGETGSWIAFDPERNLWGATVRSPAAPFNDCLPPGEVPFLKSFRAGGSLDDILDRLRTHQEESFVNPFRVILGNTRTVTIVCFHGSFQPEIRTVSAGRYRLDDHEGLTSFQKNQWLGFSTEPNQQDPLEKLLESLSPETIENHRSRDGMRSLENVLVYQWEDDLQIRTTNSLESSTNWENPIAFAS